MPDLLHLAYDELRHIRANTVAILRLVLANKENFAMTAATLDQILAREQNALDAITAETEVDKAIALQVATDRKTMEDLRAQLNEAIGLNDPAKIQAVADGMEAILAAQNTEAKVKAVLDNTGIAPPPPAPAADGGAAVDTTGSTT